MTGHKRRLTESLARPSGHLRTLHQNLKNITISTNLSEMRSAQRTHCLPAVPSACALLPEAGDAAGPVWPTAAALRRPPCDPGPSAGSAPTPGV